MLVKEAPGVSRTLVANVLSIQGKRVLFVHVERFLSYLCHLSAKNDKNVPITTTPQPYTHPKTILQRMDCLKW